MEWDCKKENEMENIKFTMSYNQFLTFGIPWKSIEKVSRLPENETLIALCGIWGEPACLRCVFQGEDGRLIMRLVYWRNEYKIPELGLSGKDLVVGASYSTVR